MNSFVDFQQVELINVNDNRPQFDRTDMPPKIQLPENADNDTVLEFKATDKDNLNPLAFIFDTSDSNSVGFPFKLVNGSTEK